MRLIDADELIRRMYTEAFEKDTDLQKWDSGCWIRYKLFENVLEELLSAQPEPSQIARDIATIIENEQDMRVMLQPEIIRCKDCKYASPNGVYGCRLERFSAHDEGTRMFADDYCSEAERRTDE